MRLGPFLSSKESRGLHKVYLSKYNEQQDKFEIILESSDNK